MTPTLTVCTPVRLCSLASRSSPPSYSHTEAPRSPNYQKHPTPGQAGRPPASPGPTPTARAQSLTWGAHQAALGLPALGLPRRVAVDTPLCLVAAPEEERRGPAEAQSCCCHSGQGHVPPGPPPRAQRLLREI